MVTTVTVTVYGLGAEVPLPRICPSAVLGRRSKYRKTGASVKFLFSFVAYL